MGCVFFGEVQHGLDVFLRFMIAEERRTWCMPGSYNIFSLYPSPSVKVPSREKEEDVPSDQTADPYSQDLAWYR